MILWYFFPQKTFMRRQLFSIPLSYYQAQVSQVLSHTPWRLKSSVRKSLSIEITYLGWLSFINFKSRETTRVLYATMKRWRIDPFCNIILPSNQPVPFPYHPVLWQGLSLCAYQPWKVRHTAWLSSAPWQHPRHRFIKCLPYLRIRKS